MKNLYYLSNVTGVHFSRFYGHARRFAAVFGDGSQSATILESVRQFGFQPFDGRPCGANGALFKAAHVTRPYMQWQ